MTTDETTLDRTATYSPEDNKLRFYPDPYEGKLPPEEYEQLKALGFRWAPKQMLFVCPRWTPAAEDLLLDWCGEITPEGTTLADRAEAKAARLEELADKREADALGFANYSRQLGERFANGQPILMGHHSQRKAERDRDKMQAAMSKATRATELAQYWTYKAAGVGHYANMKNSDRTRANRIKTLLADLRKFQRRENFTAKAIKFWELLIKDYPGNESASFEKWQKTVETLLGSWSDEGTFAPRSIRDDLRREEEPITHLEACERALAFQQDPEDTIHNHRWIAHILGRLSFERHMLGEVPRFEGDFTPAILQTFARTHGAEKPKAKKDDTEPSRPAWGPTWTIKSPTPIPAHLIQGDAAEGEREPNEITLSEHEWRELMHGVGYEVEIKKGPPPILNFKLEEDEVFAYLDRYNRDAITGIPQVTITKEQRDKIGTRGFQILYSACGGFRVRFTYTGTLASVGALEEPKGLERLELANWGRRRRVVFVEGVKAHPRPETETGIQKFQPQDA